MNFTPLVLSLACAAPADTSTPDPVFVQAKAAPGPVLGTPVRGPSFGYPSPGGLMGGPTSGPVGVPAPGQAFGTPTPEPAFDTPTPEPAFGTPTPGPVFGTPKPGPAFGAPTPEPVFGTPTPGPVFGTPKPGPVFGAPTPEPVFNTPTPAPDFGSWPGHGKLGPPAPEPDGGFHGRTAVPKFGQPSPAPLPALEQPEELLDQVFHVAADESAWAATLRVQCYPGKLKGVEVEVVLSNDWVLRSESLAPNSKPTTTDVTLLGHSRVWALGEEFTNVGAIEQEIRTLFDGVWDFKGESGLTSSTSVVSEAAVISLSPSLFQGEGFVAVPIEGLHLVHTRVDGSKDVALEQTAHGDVSLRFRFIRD